MSNDFYSNDDSAATAHSTARAALINAEFDTVEAGFDAVQTRINAIAGTIATSATSITLASSGSLTFTLDDARSMPVGGYIVRRVADEDTFMVVNLATATSSSTTFTVTSRASAGTAGTYTDWLIIGLGGVRTTPVRGITADTTVVAADLASIFETTGSSAIALTLPSIATLPAGYWTIASNQSTAVTTVGRSATDTFPSAATSYALAAGEMALFVVPLTGTQWRVYPFFPTTTFINGLTAETAPAVADTVAIYDATASATRKMTLANLFKVIDSLTAETAPATGDKVAVFDADASTADSMTLAVVMGVIAALTAKTVPVAGDEFVMNDSAASGAAKKITHANLLSLLTGALNAQDNVVSRGEFKDSAETLVSANSSTAYEIDVTAGNVIKLTMTGNCTLTIVNPSATAKRCSLLLFIVQGSGPYTITWPGSVTWAGGNAITLTTTNAKIDVVVLETLDAGTTWYGFVAGQNF